MFYSRREPGPSLLRHLAMFIVAVGLALFFLATDAGYDRAGVMGVAALLSGGYLGWQLRQFESVEAAKDTLVRRLRARWR